VIKTKCCRNGGKHPVWNETFELNINDANEQLKIQCLDEDWIVNDNIGETVIAIHVLCETRGIKKWIPIFFKGQKAGEILFFGKYVPPQ
jgi:Ca2+-dependent lipid-binding protein